MSYSRDVINAADAELARRKTEAESTQMNNMKEVFAKVPATQEIHRQLVSTVADVVKAVGMGSDADKYLAELAETDKTLRKMMAEHLVKGGYPADYLDVKYTCPDCSDTGYVAGVPCHCRTELIRKLAAEKLRKVTPLAKKCTFENFDTTLYPDTAEPGCSISPRRQMELVFDYCRNYADDFDLDSGSLYMFGATGLGKTHLSVAIANVVTDAGYNVVYGSASELLRGVEKEHFGRGNDDGALDRLLNCDLLIIDDLGSEFCTQFTVNAVYEILNTRLNHSLPVIISTNLDARELEEKYTQRVTSRVIGSCTGLQFLGNDLRQKLRENR